MSNAIRYDPPLVSFLARELDDRLSGRSCDTPPRWDPELAVILSFTDGEALRIDLHPTRGWLRLLPEERSASGPEWRLTRVSAPADERLLRFDLESGNRFRPLNRILFVELHTNQWNAILVNADDSQIVAVLRPRTVAGRPLRTGETYRPPDRQPRVGPETHRREEAESHWRQTVARAEPADRVRTLVREFAGTGTLNAASILRPMEAGTAKTTNSAFARWWALVTRSEPRPVLLELPGGSHPYPFPLPDVPSRPTTSLLAGMREAAASDRPAAADETPAGPLLAELERRRSAAERRALRLAEQLRTSEDGGEARLRGDLLLANLSAVPRGADRVNLLDWSGDEIEIELDPALSPADNANRWYDRAKRQQRAIGRIPALIRAAEAERDQWAALLGTARETGEVPDRVRRALVGKAAGGAGGDADRRLPFRTFRTTGGLEVRVGRGSADNDRLTFGHSRPNDVWLHARSVPGSHVVLRWADGEQQPPNRDLAEAAGLAAWFSKARTSGLVAVDWTRRKHVRKPRGAPPGSVTPARVKTVFVEPDASLVERLEVAAFAADDDQT